MHALVTGAAGFIGSHLVDKLLAAKFWVTGVDDLSAGTSDNLKFAAENEQFKLFPIPVADILTERIGKVDIIYHLAARIGVGQILADPLQMLEEHIEDIQLVCQKAHADHAIVVLMSSSEVYGNNDGGLLNERGPFILGDSRGPRWGYAITKLYAEQYLLRFLEQVKHKFPFVILRPFNIMGPRQRVQGGCVIPGFVDALLRGRPMHVHGDGQQERSFCHVAHVVQLLYDITRRDEIHGRIINVGRNASITILGLAQLINLCALERGLDSVEIKMVPFDPIEGYAQMRWRKADLSQLHALGYNFDTPKLQESISEIIRHMMDVRLGK